MTRRTTALAATLLFCTVPASGQSAESVLRPATKWQVDYGNPLCSLSRKFGETNNQLTLGIIADPGSKSVELALAETGIAGGRRGTATLEILGASTPVEARDVVAGPIESGGRITRGYVMRADLDGLRVSSLVKLQIDNRPVALELTGFRSALKALSTCEAEMLRRRGLDPEALSRIRTPAKPAGSPGYWLTDDDYPPGAFRRREQGMVGFRADIDAQGRITDCAVTRSSGFSELDDKVCKMLTLRARFEPARDEAGTAVPSIFVSRFTWRIP